ncbi:MAG TPA: GH116 family glycosyl-hydrolase, partial [Luteolibacter sp.]|nr:GH116 family glycosyl-hydrolase [Luteolibacter sp.]
MKRRPFLKLGGLTGLSLGFSGQRVFSAADDAASLYAKFVPAEKDLPADWLASLTKRGHPLDAAIRQSKADGNLDVIGMTVGGIACGTVYLSGDGRLWVWDIFNQHHEGVVANNKAEIPEGLQNIGQSNRKPRERDGANFLLPPRVDAHRNGVDARVTLKYAENEFPMDASGWDEVTFTNRWPVGRVDYASKKTPLKVRLESYSPFIPLDLKSSSLPVTVLEYTIENPTSEAVDITLTAHLNNPAGQFSKRGADRFSEAFKDGQASGLFHGLRGSQTDFDAGSMAIAALGDASADPGRNTVTVAVNIPANGSQTVRFAIAWHFPNLHPQIGIKNARRHYVKDFANAREVVAHFVKHKERLSSRTMAWVETWYDSSLPRWLMERTILTANTLQTQNCLILEDGRFWAWEGVGCCPGTCGHVWQYSQGHARLFPEIERNLREVTDYGIAQKPDGSIVFRGTNGRISAIDSQCAYVLRTLRDHQLSDDPDYLKRVWEPTRKAISYLVEFDRKDPRGGLDGLLDGEQHNTLDAEWFGKVHVLCSMYLAALRAGEEMAREMGDAKLAGELRDIHAMGAKNIGKLHNGEFYEQIEDPAHLDKIGVGKGCYIDQVMGQFWANQVGLGRIQNADHQKSALRALWKYNFVPEYGSFR